MLIHKVGKHANRMAHVVTDANLPEFANPPLSEVALGVQFEPLNGLLGVHIGEYWAEFKQEFPYVEQHAPLEPVIERKGVRVRPLGPPIAQFLPGPPSPRVWFIDSSKQELIQIQQDRLVRNWRKTGTADIYPRYEKHIRPAFFDTYRRFESFVATHKLGEIKANQCEVTYVNHIDLTVRSNTPHRFSDVFSFWTKQDGSNPPGLECENITAAIRFEISDETNGFIGRLHVTVEPAVNIQTNETAVVLRLMARGRPIGSGVEGVLNFLDLGRAHIVRTFTSITTEEMHTLWGRTDVRR